MKKNNKNILTRLKKPNHVCKNLGIRTNAKQILDIIKILDTSQVKIKSK